MWRSMRYRRRVEGDLGRWQEAGWVTPQGATAIRNDLAKATGVAGLAQSLSTLAAVLIGFAAMSFVAANWEEMSRLGRLSLLIGGLVASYTFAGVLFSRGLKIFGDSAVLLGSALFGGSIMLVSQMYHMHGNPADAVLIWALGALLAGTALRSNPALALAMVLVSVWGWMKTADHLEVYWPFLIGWAAVASALFWRGWAAGVPIAGLPLTVFVISLGYLLNDGHAQPVVLLIGLATVALAVAGEKAFPDYQTMWSGMLYYAMVTAFFALFSMQFIEDRNLADFIVLAIATLGLLLAAIWWGLHSGHRNALWLGYVGFSVEILGIYFKKFGNLLDTSLFFLIAGVIVAGLAVVALRLSKGNDGIEFGSKEAV